MSHFFTIPNKITITRIILVPVFLFFMLSDFKYSEYVAAFIFLMLSLSDTLDGYFARKKNQITDIGKIIDPIADKILIGSALIFLAGKGVPLWAAAAIISREAVITLLRIYVVLKGRVIAASALGKWKTIFQTIAVFAAILKIPFAWIILLVAVILTLVSGIDYIIKVRKITNTEIINIPNAVTLIRFLLIPFFISLVLKSETTFSLIVFSIIVASDKLDGMSARLTNQITKFGSAFDSFTDWTCIILVFAAFIIANKIGYAVAIAMAVSGILSGMSKMIYAKKKKQVPTTVIAKIATGFTYITVFSILMNMAYSNIFITIMLGLVYSSVAVYLIKAAGLPREQNNKS